MGGPHGAAGHEPPAAAQHLHLSGDTMPSYTGLIHPSLACLDTTRAHRLLQPCVCDVTCSNPACTSRVCAPEAGLGPCNLLGMPSNPEQSMLYTLQAGQPRWSVQNFPATAPGLHLSYHDGEHYNSIRLADDYGPGPPQPVVVTAAGLAAAAAAQVGTRGRWAVPSCKIRGTAQSWPCRWLAVDPPVAGVCDRHPLPLSTFPAIPLSSCRVSSVGTPRRSSRWQQTPVVTIRPSFVKRCSSLLATSMQP